MIMAKVMKNDDRIYVGIDFSKEKFNACLRLDTGVMGEAEFPNTKPGFLKLVRWVKATAGQGKGFCYDKVVFCGEHTGTYSLRLSEYLYGKGLKMWLENALTIKFGSGFQRVKTDKADAEMIAVYAERFYNEGVTSLFVPQSADLKNLRSLYSFRQRVVRERVAIGNALAAGTYDCSSLAKRQMQKRHREGVEDAEAIRKEMVNLMADSQELAENYRILTSFKGVGPLTAAVLLIYTSNFTKFDDARKFACFCGVAPFGKQSGTSVNTRPHVSRFAHIPVKAALVEAAKCAMRTNPVIRAYAARLRERGKEEGVIVNNVKNKILHILFKMVSTKKEWDENHLSDKSGNQSPRLFGVEDGKGATEAAPVSDISVQTSPSALWGTQIYENAASCSKLSKKTCTKCCEIT